MNLHGLLRVLLRHVRIPIPPPQHSMRDYAKLYALTCLFAILLFSMPPQHPQDESGDFFDTQLKSYVGFERQWADTTARFLTQSFGSIWFLNSNLAFIFGWIIVNLGLIPGVRPFDPYPFALLLMIVAFSAMLLAIVVLINQNRQGKMEDVRQRIDFEVNVRAEREITKILSMLDELNVNLGMVKADKELDKMKEKLDIVEIKEDIEQGIEKEDQGKSRRPRHKPTS